MRLYIAGRLMPMRTIGPRRSTVTFVVVVPGPSLIFNSWVSSNAGRFLSSARTPPLMRAAGATASPRPAAVAWRKVRRLTGRCGREIPLLMLPSADSNGPQCQGDALTAPYTQRDDAPTEAVAMHRVQKTGGQHCAGRADRMTMRNGSALDIDNIVGEAELLSNSKRHGREGLVNLK